METYVLHKLQEIIVNTISFCGNYVSRKPNVDEIYPMDVKIEVHTLFFLGVINVHPSVG